MLWRQWLLIRLRTMALGIQAWTDRRLGPSDPAPLATPVVDADAGDQPPSVQPRGVPADWARRVAGIPPEEWIGTDDPGTSETSATVISTEDEAQREQDLAHGRVKEPVWSQESDPGFSDGEREIPQTRTSPLLHPVVETPAPAEPPVPIAPLRENRPRFRLHPPSEGPEESSRMAKGRSARPQAGLNSPGEPTTEARPAPQGTTPLTAETRAAPSLPSRSPSPESRLPQDPADVPSFPNKFPNEIGTASKAEFSYSEAKSDGQSGAGTAKTHWPLPEASRTPPFSMLPPSSQAPVNPEGRPRSRYAASSGARAALQRDLSPVSSPPALERSADNPPRAPFPLEALRNLERPARRLPDWRQQDWPALTGTSEDSRQEAAADRLPWPNLPESEPLDPAEPVGQALREKERLHGLDREQRGAVWSE